MEAYGRHFRRNHGHSLRRLYWLLLRCLANHRSTLCCQEPNFRHLSTFHVRSMLPCLASLLGLFAPPFFSPNATPSPFAPYFLLTNFHILFLRTYVACFHCLSFPLPSSGSNSMPTPHFWVKFQPKFFTFATFSLLFTYFSRFPFIFKLCHILILIFTIIEFPFESNLSIYSAVLSYCCLPV